MAFDLGRVVATPGALALGVSLRPYLRLHMMGEWGELGAEDAAANDRALAVGGRIVSAYQTARGRLWIITEADRSVTTLLLPEEY